MKLFYCSRILSKEKRIACAGEIMDIKLFDSELKVMEVLWKRGDVTAKELAAELKEQIGWSKTTTYTVIKKCIDKGAVERIDPNFVCHSVITKAQAQEYETRELIDKMYGGHADQLVACLLGGQKLSQKSIEQLKKLVQDLEKEQDDEFA